MDRAEGLAPSAPGAELPLKTRAGVLPRTRRRLQSLGNWLELIRNLAVRDVETRYKHSLLGLYWTIINPLVTAAIFGFVFGVIFHASSKPIPYVVFVLCNLTFWNFFANAIMSATASVTGNSSLLAKIYFPRVVLPTAAVLARFIDFGFSLLVLGIIILIYHVGIYMTAPAVVGLLVIQLAFTLGFGYVVAALNVLYRDVTQLVGLLMMVWMYVSPVMYRIDGVSSAIQSLLLLNPMGVLIESERNLIFRGRLLYPEYIWLALAMTAFVFLAGLLLFKKIEPLFAEVM